MTIVTDDKAAGVTSKEFRHAAGAPTPPKAWIGTADQPIRVIALSGGGFSTAMQLGVAHALMVARAQPPDLVAGTSAGAIHATVLAEVMKAGESSENDQERLTKQIQVFTRYLEEELSAPAQLPSLLMPDAYQVESRAPLEPLRVPTQSEQQREHREEGISSRLELIRLVNDFVGIRLSVGDATRLLRAVLGYRAAGEADTVAARSRQEFLTLGWLSYVFLTRPIPLASITRHIQGPVLKRYLKDRGLWPLKPKHVGESAAQIMYRPSGWPKLKALLAWGLALTINAGLWSGLVVVTCFKAMAAIWAHVGWGAVTARVRKDGEPVPAGPLPNASLSRVSKFLRWVMHALLRERKLAGSLLESDVLRAFFVRVFDPTYYGVIDDKALDAAIALSFRDPRGASKRTCEHKTIAHYAEARPPIHLGVVAANLRTGKLELLPPETPVVDALLAAIAVVPFFDVQQIGTEWYVDAMNISREPTQVVIDHLRDKAHPQASGVIIYPVNHLTSARLPLSADAPSYATWVEVAGRAYDLKNFRDAQLEWRLIRLINRVLPEGQARCTVGSRTFLRTEIRPIEPDATLSIAGTSLEADARRQELILSAIAQGCRATLEATLEEAIRLPGDPNGERPKSRRCWEVVGARLGDSSRVTIALEAQGPGVPRICSHCSYCESPGDGQSPTVMSGYLRSKPETTPHRHDWPLGYGLAESAVALTRAPSHEPRQVDGSSGREVPNASSITSRFEGTEKLKETLKGWPRPRELAGKTVLGSKRPLVSLLFSGGVFRGVYLVGVVNALKEAGIRPDIVAGASVGSITAALAADIFARPSSEQSLQMARFASVFVALDRLILTDRLADFVRTFTIRAAQSRFSMRDVDRVLRRYDEGATGAFATDLRRVLAGLERLVYLTPFEFRDMTAAFRYGKYPDVSGLIERQLHKWLRRDNAYEEILGAEPLAQIMDSYVLQGHYRPPRDRTDVPFQVFLDKGIYLLATATNLTKGQLEILGDVISHESAGTASKGGVPPSLLEGLLASSAFPGIFRPRWSWEVFRGGGDRDQYTDGGVMDNLPLDAVAHFLYSASRDGKVEARPKMLHESREVEVPHLLFTASLETDAAKPPSEAMPRYTREWYRAMQRSQQLGYNRKIDSYKAAQRHLRMLYKARCEEAEREGTIPSFVPADLEIVDIRPKWLCSTFAFHPMLGFRRQRQAESIAHGCASTLVELQRLVANPETRAWTTGWGIQAKQVECGTAIGLKPRTDVPLETGQCVFRSEAMCPFSPPALSQLELDENTQRQLKEIYYACRRPETHQEPRES